MSSTAISTATANPACHTQAYTSESYAVAKGYDPEFDWSEVHRWEDLPYVPTGQTTGQVVASINQTNQLRAAMSRWSQRGQILSTDELVETIADVENAKPVRMNPLDAFEQLEEEVTAGSAASARTWKYSPPQGRLPTTHELCMTADNQLGYVINLPIRCEAPHCAQSFRAGQTVRAGTQRHVGPECAGYQSWITDRHSVPSERCSGCNGRSTGYPVLTDVGGSRWWHMIRTNQNTLQRCGSTTVWSQGPRQAPKQPSKRSAKPAAAKTFRTTVSVRA